MKRPRCLPRRTRGWTWGGVGSLLLHAALAAAPPPATAQQPPDAAPEATVASDILACKKSLNRIYEAIQEYRRVNKHLPNYLSDLNPEFVAEPRLFICPEVQRRGDYQTWRQGVAPGVFLDLILPTTYAYEFCAAPYPLWAGFSTTVQEYKMRQLKILGSNVPILRCLVHRPYVNVPFAGAIYTSGTDWENNFAQIVPIEKLLPPEVFLDMAPIPGRFTGGIRPRDPATDPALIDLNRFYVADLRKPWLWTNPREKNLAALPQGTVKLPAAPVSFDIRGVIQLNGSRAIAPFPTRVEGIPVIRRCRVIHFLQGAVFKDSPGTQIGQYEIHYADQHQSIIPILYGRDVLPAWDATGTERLPGRLAWQGGSPREDGSTNLARLYLQAWTNPVPAVQIESIGFVSSRTAAAPFLIAISLEP